MSSFCCEVFAGGALLPGVVVLYERMHGLVQTLAVHLDSNWLRYVGTVISAWSQNKKSFEISIPPELRLPGSSISGSSVPSLLSGVASSAGAVRERYARM